jgi:hypothetical protein
MSYVYVWHWEAETVKSYDTQAVGTEPQARDPFNAAEVVAQAKYTTIAAATEAFVKKFAEQGINVKVLTVTPYVDLTVSKEVKIQILPYGGQIPYTVWHHYLKISADVKFQSDKPLSSSPITPIVAVILIEIAKWIIIALVAAFAVYKLTEWLQSMTTKKTIITRIDPSTGQPITEEVTEPSLFGVAGLGGIVVLLLLVYMFMREKGKRKKEGEK